MTFIVITLTLLFVAWILAALNGITWEHAVFAALFISH